MVQEDKIFHIIYDEIFYYKKIKILEAKLKNLIFLIFIRLENKFISF